MSEVARTLAAILSADAVGYSRLMAEDEAGTIHKLGAYRHEIAGLVGDHRGRVVDAPGDNVLAEFPTALDAVECAVEIQRVLKVRNDSLYPERRMAFRVGVHLGEVAEADDRLYGDGVIIAARLEGLAEPGGLCISRSIYEVIHGKLALAYDDLGDQTVKNIPDPVHAYRVRLEAPAQPAARDFRSAARHWAGVAGALVMLLVLGATIWHLLGRMIEDPTTDASSIRSLAVLPLENLSGDPEQEYFADAMTDVLIGELARIGSLSVISRTSVMQYKGAREKALPVIARELNVHGVIEGTIFRQGDRVRITVQLIDARSDHHLWSESFDRDLRDILALQSEVARAMSERIELQLTPQQEAHLTETRRVDPEAMEAFLRGSYHGGLNTPSGTATAIDYFESAIQKDPSFARAYAALAIVYADAGGAMEVLPPHEAAVKLRDAARKALALDDSLGEAHTASGYAFFFDWQWEQAGRVFERGVELTPSDPWSLDGLSWFRLVEGRPEAAIALMERAVALNPADPTLRPWYAHRLVLVRHYEAGLEEARSILKANPQNRLAQLSLFASLLNLERRDEAARALIHLLELDEDPHAEAAQRDYRAGGFEGLMRGIIEVDLERVQTSEQGAVIIAERYAVLGEVDLAFEWLERGYQTREPWMMRLVYMPWFEPLRSDPRYTDLLRRMNFPGSQDSYAGP